ncbi:hypothetical protein DSO57_1035127 [Entomophthora muscae]|uniref:Uncharacterized protein n=1 Tax=Entomophthora muscae TaxID=34485 RepID=A0ACC2U9F5_9FUNG|nr:hypothetical protein DSO57_1035127 [Entomophthora muscae]
MLLSTLRVYLPNLTALSGKSPQLFNNVTAHLAQRLLSSLVLTMYANTLSVTPQLSPAAQTQFMVAFSRPCSPLRLMRFSHYSSQCVS